MDPYPDDTQQPIKERLERLLSYLVKEINSQVVIGQNPTWPCEIFLANVQNLTVKLMNVVSEMREEP